MTPRHEALRALIEVAGIRAQNAATQLQRLTGRLRDAMRQASILEEYRQDYAARLQQTMRAGLSMPNYHNFHRFIASLDEAISQQNRTVAQINANLEQSRIHWSHEKRRLLSYEAWSSRLARQQALHEARGEQRANDEIAANFFRRTRPTDHG